MTASEPDIAKRSRGGTHGLSSASVLCGNCREAFIRCQEIFGGELVLAPMKDMPSEEDVPADQADLIMHAALTFGDNLLMASDDPTTDGFGPVQGMMVNYTVADVDEAKRVFEALADGGAVTQPIAETFWSPTFGTRRPAVIAGS
jgi:PhnB protein